MKKIIVCIPILLTLSLTAQIRVDCSGYYPTVGIGTNPQPNFYLTTSSRVKFDLGSYVGLIIDPSAYYALALYPTSNNHGNIGRSDRAFREIWAYNYYDLNSDSSQKENIRPLTNALQIVKGLRGIKYDLKREVEKGNSSIVVAGNELKAGIYIYSLIADGQWIDSKRMVLTD